MELARCKRIDRDYRLN
jgi:hypothetical protein